MHGDVVFEGECGTCCQEWGDYVGGEGADLRGCQGCAAEDYGADGSAGGSCFAVG